MPKKSKMGKTRHDKWYHLAKEQGYRSRASFKLVQLNKKYDFLSSSHALLDLCAAPGGWLQVAQKYMPAGSLIIGIDLLPIKAIPGVVTLQQDILTQKCRQQIKKESNGWKFDTVIHDGAPNVGGNSWVKDAYGQVELVLHSLKLSTEFLKPGGHFITKVFRSQDYNALLWVMQQFFKKVDVTKPTASRNTSAEIYIVGLGYLAPKSIDPRLLDPVHVFKPPEEEPKKVSDILSGKISKRANRSGYADGVTMLYSEKPVADFVVTDDPIDMLGRHNKLVWDEESAPYLEHETTNDEIKALVDDLKVIGKNDFRRLLKWRSGMRAFRKELLAADRVSDDEDDEEAEAAAAAAAAEEAEKNMTAEERAALEDERLTKELREMQKRKRHRERVARRKRREDKFKARRRAAMSLNAADVAEDDTQESLFSLRRIPDAEALDGIEADGVRSDGNTSGEGSAAVDSELDEMPPSDEDDEMRRERLDRELDSLYGEYKIRRKIASHKDRKAAKRVGFFEGEDDEDMAVAAASEKAAYGGLGSDSSDSSDADGAENPLVVPLGGGKIGQTPEARARRWFDGDLFQGIANGEATPAAAAPASRKRKASGNASSASSSDEDEDSREMRRMTEARDAKASAAPAAAAGAAGARRSARAGRAARAAAQEAADFASSDSEDDRAAEAAAAKARAASKARRAAAAAKATSFADASSASSDSDSDSDPEVRRRKRLAKRSGFEEVAEESDYSDDSDARAEVLALGKRFLHKKSRQNLEDSAYNRYTWGEEDLPEWFVNDEEMHNKPQMPITKDEVDVFKAQLQAINARPAKKIAEARARNKMKKVQRLEKVKAQAESIVKNDGLNSQEKLRSIEKLYSGAKGKKKKVDRKYVVARKSGGQLQAEARRGHTGPVQVVDKRLKCDKRAQRRAEKRNKKRRRK